MALKEGQSPRTETVTVKLSFVALSMESYETHVQRYLKAGSHGGRSSGLDWSWVWASLASGWETGHGNRGGSLGSVHGVKSKDAPGTDF